MPGRLSSACCGDRVGVCYQQWYEGRPGPRGVRVGHPVVGDARYGGPDRRLGSGRFFLHAGRLAFTHPGTHERVEFAAPLPEDLEGYEPA